MGLMGSCSGNRLSVGRGKTENRKQKKILITGAASSFGNAVLNRFLHTDHFKEIRIFLRDERK